MKRFSKRRQCILDNLESRKDHPTADMVYRSVRDQIPNISLGTVYRNLKDLADEGVIISFTQNGKEHFDGNNHPHMHLCCSVCGKIEDLPDFMIRNVIIQGVCSDCIARQTEDEVLEA